MDKINLYNLGLNERYIQETEMYEKYLYIARVSTQYKDMYKIITENGEILAKVSGKLIYSSDSITDYRAVGDWVLVDRTTDINGNAVIHRILSRRSYFERKVSGAKTKDTLQMVKL
ncbi:GTPase [Clostridium kluyveri]|uniref:Predicted GTPase n=2 Tax=Clostridium kluyveri TaxID=1534 RepID=A5N5H5_CLOK5|nr:GTPase [Clostridium kluyveri]EDK32556.1 Predicted GTPase [Clostridium kluyveri DSM 555]BAH05491.1 hypothetical protein CKR_0440 [Clostridium kluyveri NBRC 12016]